VPAPSPSRKTLVVVVVAGLCYAGATSALALTQTPLGTPLFFSLVAVCVGAYGALMVRLWSSAPATPGAFAAALVLAALIRVPLAVAPVHNDNDMIRYLWDGRIQKLGFNPYAVLPADPQLQWTHTDETRDMPSARHRTPYPPAAQMFFRLVVIAHDSARAMKLAIVMCDLLTVLVVWRWLAATGRNPWLTLAYAWNPLVVLEAAHSGHIDVLSALWIVASVYWLARRRTALATVAFVLAVTTKLLPIVVAPLFIGRISRRDALLGAALLVILYLPFMAAPQSPLGGVNMVIESVRFNGPLFRAIRTTTSPPVAAAAAVFLGLLTAAWCRWKLEANNPAAWAWPMAVALACAPVIYPWYLLAFTPFLLTRETFPLIAWTISIIPAYVVWEVARRGGSWVVPGPVLAVEYGTVLLAGLLLLWSKWRRRFVPTDGVGP
jgi:alpha-1,6-mannosyltransferase